MYGIGLRIKMFFFKKKKIVVDAFTKISGINDLFPIEPSKKFLPRWWKNISPFYTVNELNDVAINRSTIKQCDGIRQFYNHGFIIPAWIDMIIKTDKDGNWGCKLASNDTDTRIDSHNRLEFGTEFNDFIHVKIQSPWLLKEKTGCKFYYTSPFWNQITHLGNFYTPPGIVNYKDQSSTQLNLFFPVKDNAVTVNAGMPLVHLIPLTEYDVEIRCHAVTSEEYDQIYLKNYVSSFFGNYKKNKKFRESAGKCPIGF